MSGKRGQGVQYGGFKSPKQGIDDNFDLPQVKGTREVLIGNAEKLKAQIRKLENQLLQIKNPEMRKRIQGDINKEKTRLASILDAINYYKKEIQDEETKSK